MKHECEICEGFIMTGYVIEIDNIAIHSNTCIECMNKIRDEIKQRNGWYPSVWKKEGKNFNKLKN